MITIWDLTSLKKRRPLTCAESVSREFVCLAFSPDSKYLMAQGGGPDWLLCLWTWEKNPPKLIGARIPFHEYLGACRRRTPTVLAYLKVPTDASLRDLSDVTLRSVAAPGVRRRAACAGKKNAALGPHAQDDQRVEQRAVCLLLQVAHANTSLTRVAVWSSRHGSSLSENRRVMAQRAAWSASRASFFFCCLFFLSFFFLADPGPFFFQRKRQQQHRRHR